MRPDGALLGEGDLFRFPELAEATRAARRRGRGAVLPRATSRAGSRDWVRERGGTLGRDDMAAYEPIAREPVRLASAAARC